MTTRRRNRGTTPTAPVVRMVKAPTAEPTTEDVDWVAVERAANGLHPRVDLNLAEQRAATLLMLTAGYTEPQISARLCIYQRQVSRWKADGKPLVAPSRRSDCSYDGCKEPNHALGLCDPHYRAQRRQQGLGRAA